MNELAERWVKALRSDKYTQGNGLLRYYDEYCCLGVACDVIDSTKWDSSDYGDIYIWGSFADVQLGTEELEALGITDPQQRELIKMNDAGDNFETIADRIEEMIAENERTTIGPVTRSLPE